MNINNFVNSVTGVAVTNRYIVNLGEAGQKYFAPLGIDYKFHTKSVIIPGKSLKEFSSSYWGAELIVAGNVDMDTFEITWLCDKDMLLRKAFTNWQTDAFDTDSWTANFYIDYAFDISVSILNKMGQTVATITVWGAFPKDLGNVELSFDNDNQPMEFSTTFEYWDYGYVFAK